MAVNQYRHGYVKLVLLLNKFYFSNFKLDSETLKLNWSSANIKTSN